MHQVNNSSSSLRSTAKIQEAVNTGSSKGISCGLEGESLSALGWSHAGTGAPRDSALSILGNTKNPAGCSSEQPAVPLWLCLCWMEVRLGDHQKSLPTQTILCIYAPNLFLVSRMWTRKGHLPLKTCDSVIWQHFAFLCLSLPGLLLEFMKGSIHCTVFSVKGMTWCWRSYSPSQKGQRTPATALSRSAPLSLRGLLLH